jgi:hypothetical protein
MRTAIQASEKPRTGDKRRVSGIKGVCGRNQAAASRL